MSEVRVENITGETGVDAVNFTKGINVTGVATATNISVGSSVTAGTLFGNAAGVTNFAGGKLLKKTSYTINRQTISASTFPNDDTIPQITEGTEFFSQAYTPSTANCDLYIFVNCRISEASNVGNEMAMGLFINDNTDCLRVVSGYTSGVTNVHGNNLFLIHRIASWGVSAKTFSLRAHGGNAINYAGANGYGQAYYGDATHATFFIIEEIAT
tara:strand:- start:82 stop:720 length:639 start_codon:yes stop_codon:yes gene_type:complete